MKLSVIIPCLNAAKTISAQLDALKRQEWEENWEVIVADNGSTDATLDVIETRGDGLPYLQVADASDRPGAGHARNVGALFARGEFLVFCDSDDEVGDGWLAAIASALSEHDFVASRFDIEKLNPPRISGKLRNTQATGVQRIKYPPYLKHAGGSGLGVNRKLHERIGGFDESLLRLQDTDYCFRLQLLGYELHFAADALVHVRFSSNPGVLFRQSRLWAMYNELLYKRYGDGLPLSHPWLTYLKGWCDLIRSAPRVFRKDTRPAWVKALGTQIGLLQGAARFLVPPVR